MTKAFANYINKVYYNNNGKFHYALMLPYEVCGIKYVFVNCVGFVGLKDPVEGFAFEDVSCNSYMFKFLYKAIMSNESNYHLAKFPSLCQVTEGIRECVGRKRCGVRYYNKEEGVACNARFLKDVLQAIGEQKYYVYVDKEKEPIVFRSSLDGDMEWVIGIMPIRMPIRMTSEEEKEEFHKI